MPRRFSGESPWRRTRRIYAAPQPGAGAEFVIPVPSGVLWELISLWGLLTTSAAVGSRRPRATVSDGTTVGLISSANLNTAASSATRYSWLQVGSVMGTGADATASLPPLVVESGWVIASATVGLDVADQWSSIAYMVIETTVQGGDVDLGSVPTMLVEVANS